MTRETINVTETETGPIPCIDAEEVTNMKKTPRKDLKSTELNQQSSGYSDKKTEKFELKVSSIGSFRAPWLK